MNKLIISDLDGTLLRSDKTISQYSIDILKKCKNAGYKLIFATARPPRDTYKYLPNDLKDDIIICYNGAVIIKNNKILHSTYIDRKTVLDILKVSEKSNLNNICLEIEDTLYSNFDVTDYFGKIPCKIVNLKELNFTKAFKVIICSKEPINTDFLSIMPKECKGIITDNGTLCQIMNVNVSKWNSIEYIINNYYKCNSEDIIAFGDDYNDIEMIQNCGIGVAMGNAVKELKDVAKYVTKSNDEDGVGWFLENSITSIN